MMTWGFSQRGCPLFYSEGADKRLSEASPEEIAFSIFPQPQTLKVVGKPQGNFRGGFHPNPEKLSPGTQDSHSPGWVMDNHRVGLLEKTQSSKVGPVFRHKNCRPRGYPGCLGESDALPLKVRE
jgi:hypothetical protein